LSPIPTGNRRTTGQPAKSRGCETRVCLSAKARLALAPMVSAKQLTQWPRGSDYKIAWPRDVAVDRAIVDVDLVVVGDIHQGVAAFHHAGTGGDRLQLHIGRSCAS
jgi:hypothetical protein